MNTNDLTRGEIDLLLRALRVYSGTYQELKGKSPHPDDKRDLQNHIDAADRLAIKLRPFRRDTQV